ncbi:winged helix-turn-helix transcriptional regulator [Streptomyces sp. A1499]|uniref:winged helix-turn-helix transcriptional regulator n=1 Tax=Streptomyces sp. A1499 TaxID=2563104 RepID=UPI00109EDE3B|nr:winged helix-turn-helix transcriptional regulator [Streptomyces sp. A1499]THC47326.1 hypothetical protein E7X58_27825 [Streptomyces sp. A1499]
MTAPGEGLLFDVSAPPTSVERLLLLADRSVQHNDMLDRLLRAGAPSGPHAHAASAHQLAAATRAALTAVTDERLCQSHDLSDAMARLQQLAFLSSAAADQQLPMARTLTALAPAAAMGCADTFAHEIRRRHGNSSDAPDHGLTATLRTALWEIACGNVVTTSALGRQYVHYRDERVLISTLRALEANGLAERVPTSAPSAYVGGPLQDRVRLTAAGTTALASTLSNPPARSAPGTYPAPAPTAASTAARSR